MSVIKRHDQAHTEQSLPLFLTKIVNNADNNFQQLDHDNASIEWMTPNIEHVDILHNAESIQHLIKTMRLDFKYFTDQTLTLHVTLPALNREGITKVELLHCHPLPIRILINEGPFDFGVSYLILV